MKIEELHINHIKLAFAEMQTREDLLDLLNYAKPLIYGNQSVPFELRQITFYANPKRSINSYKEFKIKKKSGAARTIHAPQKGLKALQKTLSLILQCVFEPHKAAMGFVNDKSIVDNAKFHEGSNYVYNIDLKDFFSSVDQARVWSCLKLKPFNLVVADSNTNELSVEKINTGIRKFITEAKEEILYKFKGGTIFLVHDKKGNYNRYKKRIENSNKDFFEDVKRYILSSENIEQLSRLIVSREILGNIIASLTCTKMAVERINSNGEWEVVNRHVLPQGAPTSPVLTNVVCQRLDYLLTGVANRFGLRYTRYADDISFSSMHNVYQENGDFLIELHRIINDQGFHIKASKTRLLKEGHRKEVTGLLVNEKTNVQKRYTKQLRMWLYYWERYGYERASVFFKKQYIADRGNVTSGEVDMNSVIRGKLDYLKMVKGGENKLYLKLRERFEILSSKDSFIAKVLKVWEEKGIDSAMKLFYSKHIDKSPEVSKIEKASKETDFKKLCNNKLT